jgi:hypothetical protein
MVRRNLDGLYFRIERDGKWQDICFTDLTQQERDRVMANRSERWLASVVNYLADVIAGIGEEFDLVRE